MAPSAAVIDAASVRAAKTVRQVSRGFDAGTKVNGRQRQLAVDTLGLLTGRGVQQQRKAAKAAAHAQRGQRA